RRAALRDEAAAASRDHRGTVGFPGRGVGGSAGATGRAPRGRRDYDRRPARIRSPRRRLGGARGCRDVAATPGRHEPRPDAHAHPGGGGAHAARAHAQARAGGRWSRGGGNPPSLRRPAAPRVRRARPTAEPMIALLLLLLPADGWGVWA